MSGLVFAAGGVVGVGEAMVEFAPVDGGLFRRGFAGDTLNTSWYLRRLLPSDRPVAYATRVGTDAVSDEMVAFLADAGLAVDHVGRDGERTVGLYTISLDGAERRFSYWRETSAARRLADDRGALDRAFAGAALIHVSGITLAVIGEAGRERLLAALAAARASGARVSFDPNLRRRLWGAEETIRDAFRRAFAVCDVALPSFDDEAALWGDATPHDTARRIAALGVAEVVVKDGARPAIVCAEGRLEEVPAVVAEARDTTGAGDAFDAGHLALRLAGRSPLEACRFAHRLAAEVVRHPGALMPPAALAPFVEEARTAFERSATARG